MTAIEKAEERIERGDFAEAEKLLDAILIEEPDNLRAVCAMGITLSETGKLNGAVKALNYYLNREKGNSAAWEAMGCTYFRQKKYRMARDYLEKALELTPENPSVLRNLGILYTLIGKSISGRKMIEKSHRIEDQDYKTLYALVYVHYEEKEVTKARQYLAQMLEMEIPEEIRKEAELLKIKLDINW